MSYLSYSVLSTSASGGPPWAGCASASSVDHYAELAPAVPSLDRGRLYIYAANGEAVYVPDGPSPLQDYTRYDRLYRRP